jgi:predicted dehydrogenase
VAVAGTNNRGLEVIQALAGIENAEIAYVCDVEDGALAKGMKEVAKEAPGARPKALKDFRRALDDKAIDAIAIVTPDHWHVPMAILALAAGKHVYVEKPCSHNPREGELLKQAIAKYGRIVQMGNQKRTYPNLQAAIHEIRGGVIGTAYHAQAWYNGDRLSLGHGSVVPVPPSLDYELWQGPAPRRPYRNNVIPYNWHWFWNWGTGEACNNGVHEIDLSRWALGVDFPSKVSSSGGRYRYKDDWETPDTQVIGWEFGREKSITWAGRSCNGFPTDGLNRGVVVYGTEGAVVIDGNEYTIYDRASKKVRSTADAGPNPLTTKTVAGNRLLDQMHVRNFIDAIRTGSPINSPIEEGHKTVLLPQLGNIAQRLGRSLDCNPADGHILNDEEAMKLWRRDYEPGWEPMV